MGSLHISLQPVCFPRARALPAPVTFPLITFVRTCELVYSWCKTDSSAQQTGACCENYSERDSNRSTTAFSRVQSLPYLSLFEIRIANARARVICNCSLVAPNRVVFGYRSRVRVRVCGVLQLSSSLVFLAHITIARHGSDYRTISCEHGH